MPLHIISSNALKKQCKNTFTSINYSRKYIDIIAQGNIISATNSWFVISIIKKLTNNMQLVEIRSASALFPPGSNRQ